MDFELDDMMDDDLLNDDDSLNMDAKIISVTDEYYDDDSDEYICEKNEYKFIASVNDYE